MRPTKPLNGEAMHPVRLAEELRQGLLHIKTNLATPQRIDRQTLAKSMAAANRLSKLANNPAVMGCAANIRRHQELNDAADSLQKICEGLIWTNPKETARNLSPKLDEHIANIDALVALLHQIETTGYLGKLF